MADFFARLSTYEADRTNQNGPPSGDDLYMLRNIFAPRLDVERADMFVTVLRFLRAHLKPTWRTPIALEVEALGDSGRFEEALALQQQDPELRIGKDRVAVADYLARRKVAGVLPRTRPNDEDYRRVLGACFAHLAG